MSDNEGEFGLFILGREILRANLNEAKPHPSAGGHFWRLGLLIYLGAASCSPMSILRRHCTGTL